MADRPMAYPAGYAARSRPKGWGTSWCSPAPEPDDGSFPDDATICQVSNRLAPAKLDQVLLHRVNVGIQGSVEGVGGSCSAINDATIIERASFPKKHVAIGDEGQAAVDRRRAGALGLESKGAFFCYGGYSAVDVEDRFALELLCVSFVAYYLSIYLIARLKGIYGGGDSAYYYFWRRLMRLNFIDSRHFSD